MKEKIEVEYQLHTYARSLIRDSRPVDLDEALQTRFDSIEELEPPEPPPERRRRWPRYLVSVAAAAVVLVLLGVIPLLVANPDDEASEESNVTVTTLDVLPGRLEPAGPPPAFPRSDNPTTTPIDDWVPGDDQMGPLELGQVAGLPDLVYLDFLARDCPECFLDARFRGAEMGPEGQGPFLADQPFMVRHGFPATGPEPLGEGFEVEVYITRQSGLAPDASSDLGVTRRYTSDYVVRGMVDGCGPAHDSQDEAVECEWFVHEFEEGLPEGRYDFHAVWLAPCSAWLEMGFTESCADPGEVISLFAASVNSPLDDFARGPFENGEDPIEPQPPGEFDEANESGNPTTAALSEWIAGEAAEGSSSRRIVTDAPDGPYLDFLSQDCPDCFRDARFKGPGLSDHGSGPWVAGRPFIVRQGFENDGDQPLGEGFDVEVFITRWEGPDLGRGVFELGVTYRFVSDYVVRTTADLCGPNYLQQTGSVECEWFVHEFDEGLPEGRYDLWAKWMAPCSAWLELGLVGSCVNHDEVISAFSSSVNSPFGQDDSILDDR